MSRVIGVPKEIKDQEGRVSMQPDGVIELVHRGHDVVVEPGAGAGAGFSDEEYEAAGARILDGPDEVFEAADLIVKVKEPVPEEYDRYKEGLELFTYLHLAADHGAEAPKPVSREMIASMRNGSVAVDVAMDQGGCIETARLTTHTDPSYTEEGVVHYCVANIPGAVARTSTLALTSVTLPYLLQIADKGVEGAAQENPVLAKGLSTLDGKLLSEPVGEAHELPYTDLDKLLA